MTKWELESEYYFEGKKVFLSEEFAMDDAVLILHLGFPAPKVLQDGVALDDQHDFYHRARTRNANLANKNSMK